MRPSRGRLSRSSHGVKGELNTMGLSHACYRFAFVGIHTLA